MAAILRGYAPLLAAIMGAAALLAVNGTGRVMAQPPFMGCINPIATLSPCLPYMVGPAKPFPEGDYCCTVLARVIVRDATCLCHLFAGHDFLGFPVNQTLVISLPAACDLLFPRPMHQCRGSNLSPPPLADVPTIPERSPKSANVPTRSPRVAKKVGSGAEALFTQSLFGISLGSVFTGILILGCFL
ncbi:hypothetical protein KI387_027489 [Taxus chinensis]|uniref:Bifunctional inhibitor/plant lipid transfer protein/seed storage helical domain-containing protein n=1 Tax=Taxus chinensis TaxID=29808 RepID=A0AA38L206_TAXCH|nr:hypothetical protein KI387_027489 [Taxus chinensis]